SLEDRFSGILWTCDIGYIGLVIGVKFVSLGFYLENKGNPLHLHPKDSNCASIVSLKLTGVDNYRIWASFMKLALQIKHKMGFINGTCDRFDYLASALLLEQWDRCNAVVLNWILSSLFQDVYLGHVFYDNTANVWNELKETYDRVDDSIVFNLLQKINTLKQGGLPVSEYYHKLNSLWREFDILTKLTDCTYVARAELVDHGKLEDSHRGMPTSSVKTEKPQVSAFVSRTNDNNIKRTNGTNGNWSNNNGSNVNIGNYDRLNPNLKPSENFNNNKTNLTDTKGNNDVKTCVGTISWTNEQVMKLMSLLNEKSGSSANAHMADSSHGRITPIPLRLVYNENEYNYNYYVIYKNKKNDLDDVK
ncbi:ribonuclease H-like domain-containing protein, partial [Tanacetum coccineum]